MKRHLLRCAYGLLASTLLAVGLTSCTSSAGRSASTGSGSTSSSTTSSTAAPANGFTVRGAQLYYQGSPFLGRGFNVVAKVTPPGCPAVIGITARQHFGQAEMAAAKSWHANILRFQVSEPGLAAGDQRQVSSYIDQIENGVALAHKNGLPVILSMQDQGIACGQSDPLPTPLTVAAWNRLAPAFAGDPKAMFELYNEPRNDATGSGWVQWESGGSSPLADNGQVAVGHQTLLDHIRSLGANNVVLVDGADSAKTLEGVPMLRDTTMGRGVVYAVHPYGAGPRGEAYWERSFGYLAEAAPVFASEWNYPNCSGTNEVTTPIFLSWLQSKGIGLTAHAFDTPGTLVTPDWTWTPTQCGTAFPGPGKQVQDYYKAQ